jgi:hypothetical protein
LDWGLLLKPCKEVQIAGCEPRLPLNEHVLMMQVTRATISSVKEAHHSLTGTAAKGHVLRVFSGLG